MKKEKKAIGVDNFKQDSLTNFVYFNKITLAVNMIECNVYFQREDEKQYSDSKNILLEAWSLLKAGNKEMFSEPILLEIAKNHQKNVAQIVLKRLIQREIVPGFYKIYSSIFLSIMKKMDLQESKQSHGKDYFDITITKCLWHTACLENGCANLCKLFCDVDDVTYGDLKKIGFTRTKTLGYGGDCCDFHFYRKK